MTTTRDYPRIVVPPPGPKARAIVERQDRYASTSYPKEYPLASDLVPALKRYMRVRLERGPYLFTGRESNNQHGLRVLQVQRLFKHYAQAAGLAPEVSSHSLRHSIAVHSLEEGFGLEYVADLLGHTSIRSTAIYAQVTTPAAHVGQKPPV